MFLIGYNTEACVYVPFLWQPASVHVKMLTLERCCCYSLKWHSRLKGHSDDGWQFHSITAHQSTQLQPVSVSLSPYALLMVIFHNAIFYVFKTLDFKASGSQYNLASYALRGTGQGSKSLRSLQLKLNSLQLVHGSFIKSWTVSQWHWLVLI